METLRNSTLAVELIDPVADRSRLGPRFCWGGYIWQVRDAAGRELLSGPEWPDENPIPFNGQGMPEVLRHTELRTNRPLTHAHGRGIVLGAGTAEWGRDGPVIVDPARWAVTSNGGTRHYCTQQAAGGWGADVNRTVTLEGSTIMSGTSVTNTGSRRLPLQWFAHPFFSLRDGRLEAILPAGCRMEENAGFSIERGTLEFRRTFDGVRDGHFQPVTPEPGIPFSAEVTHPLTSAVSMDVSFAPDQIYVWANGNTFSIEPYLITELEPGEVRSWTVCYRFGL